MESLVRRSNLKLGRETTRRKKTLRAVAGYACPLFLLALCLNGAFAQTANQTGKESQAEKDLISKAEALESRGRPDIAVQVWQIITFQR